nr:RNA-directed DNA polymerase, eukaryota [Tanacetum cinerariifolium]
CISPEESAFIKGRNILDGPLILNEVINCSVLVRGGGHGSEVVLLMPGLPNCLFGVCVSEEDILDMANIIGCWAAKLPMKYLGVPVGCNMARCNNWEAIIQKISSKFSFWKARLLSVGGRLSLIKSVLGNLPTYFMSLYLMPASIRSKLESMRSNFIIGSEMGEKKMAWVSWNKCLATKKSGGLGIGSFIRSMWGFCSNRFRGSCIIIRTCGLKLSKDSWLWSLDVSKGFTVASRLSLNKLPSRVNLDRRGIDVDSLLCPICHEDVEMVNHIFFTCELAKDLWALLARWWELDIPFCANISEWFLRKCFLKPWEGRYCGPFGVIAIIWFFSNSSPKKSLLCDSIVSQSFL